MNKLITLAIAAQIAAGTNSVKLKFQTPGPGRYQVIETTDLHHFIICAEGRNAQAVHVVVPVEMKQCGFFIVNFEPLP